MKVDRLDPKTSALLVIDMQNDYCSPGGNFDKRGISLGPTREALPTLKRLLEGARERGLFILYTAMVYDEFTLEERLHKIVPERIRDRHICMRGTWGAEVIEDLKPREGELIVEKCRYGAFYNTNLEGLLRNRGIDTVVLAGTVTNVCVESTAREAFSRDFDVVVVGDASISPNPDLHMASLRNVDLILGAALTTDEVLSALDRGAPIR